MPKSLTVFFIFLTVALLENGRNKVLGCTPRYRKDDLHKETFHLYNKFSITGGREIHPSEAPYHVSIKKRTFLNGAVVYKSICEANIIGKYTALTAAHCFLTNRKRIKHQNRYVKAVAGSRRAVATMPMDQTNGNTQWRDITRIESPRYYRYPVNDIAVLHVNKMWKLGEFIKAIPFASKLMDYKGPCMSVGYGVSSKPYALVILHAIKVEMISRKRCENVFMRNMRAFVCTHIPSGRYNHRDAGSGVVCHGTGDPQEDERGVLVAVQSKVYAKDEPALHTRVSNHYQWIIDDAAFAKCRLWVLCACLAGCLLLK